MIEPGGIIPDYAVEISDADVEILGITGSEDTMILNIVTLPSEQSSKISVNLVGPVIVNRNSLVAKQCIINNHDKYSARFLGSIRRWQLSFLAEGSLILSRKVDQGIRIGDEIEISVPKLRETQSKLNFCPRSISDSKEKSWKKCSHLIRSVMGATPQASALKSTLAAGSALN